MRKLLKKVANLMVMLMMVIFILGGTVSTNAAEQIITLNKLYAEGELTVMPVYILYDGTITASLTNESNKVIVNYKAINVTAQTTLYYKKSFKELPSGTYYLNVQYFHASEYGLADDVETRIFKINHKQTVTSITFNQTYQEYAADGALKQKFKFNYDNAKGKSVFFEIYDSYGDVVYEFSFVASYVKGGYSEVWDYYPYYGGLRVPNGEYIIKFWIDGQSPKQNKFTVKL